MSDSAVNTRLSPSNIRAHLQQAREPAPAAEQPAEGSGAADKVDPLPRPGDAYRAHGRQGNKPELTLHFVTRDYAYEGFSYADLQRMRLTPGEKPGGAPALVLRFHDAEVTIEGRRLHSLYHWIGQHRLPWIWEHPSPADFADDSGTVVGRIRIDPVER